MPTKSYTNYYKRLAGEKLPVYAEDPDLGYYAIPTRDKKGWRRVNYQLSADNSRVTCFVDGVQIPQFAPQGEPGALAWAPLWAYAVKRPIDDKQYNFHKEYGRMPWESETATADRNGASHATGENQGERASHDKSENHTEDVSQRSSGNPNVGATPNKCESPISGGSNVVPFQPFRPASIAAAGVVSAASAAMVRAQGAPSTQSTTTGATSSPALSAGTNGQTKMGAKSAEQAQQANANHDLREDQTSRVSPAHCENHGDNASQGGDPPGPFSPTTVPSVSGPALVPAAESATNQPKTSAIDDFKDRLEKLKIEADSILKKKVEELDRDTANRLGGLAGRFTEIEKSANEARVIEKQPHYTLCVNIDAKWKRVTEAAADYKKKSKARGNEYIDLQNKKVEEERKAQIAAGAPQEALTPQEPIRLGDGLGRALHQRTTKVAVITDRSLFLAQPQVFTHAIIDKALQDVANAFVKAGIECPGLGFEEQSQAV